MTTSRAQSTAADPLAVARQLTRDRAAAQIAAVEFAAELRERLSTDEDSVTADHLAAADAVIERSKLLSEAAVRALRRAQAAAPFEPILA